MHKKVILLSLLFCFIFSMSMPAQDLDENGLVLNPNEEHYKAAIRAIKEVKEIYGFDRVIHDDIYITDINKNKAFSEEDEYLIALSIGDHTNDNGMAFFAILNKEGNLLYYSDELDLHSDEPLGIQWYLQNPEDINLKDVFHLDPIVVAWSNSSDDENVEADSKSPPK